MPAQQNLAAREKCGIVLDDSLDGTKMAGLFEGENQPIWALSPLGVWRCAGKDDAAGLSHATIVEFLRIHAGQDV